MTLKLESYTLDPTSENFEMMWIRKEYQPLSLEVSVSYNKGVLSCVMKIRNKDNEMTRLLRNGDDWIITLEEDHHKIRLSQVKLFHQLIGEDNEYGFPVHNLTIASDEVIETWI